MDVTEMHDRAIEIANKVMGSVKPGQMSDSTPCTEFTVRDLINHLIGGNHMFAQVATGAKAEPAAGGKMPDLAGDNPAKSFAESAKTVVQAWRQPGVLDQIAHLPFGDMPGQMALGIHFMEVLVHSWDLAKATGQDQKLPAELAEAALGMAQGIGSEMRGPGGPFGPVVQVPDSAPIHEKLVAQLGRKP